MPLTGMPLGAETIHHGSHTRPSRPRGELDLASAVPGQLHPFLDDLPHEGPVGREQAREDAGDVEPARRPAIQV
ncbi:MAG: hypothetical protein ACRYHQ_40180, partial [Janthinobacterium lividum]